MAVSGTGTQNDPYVVTTWTELCSKANESGKYVKLGNNINLNDEFPEGITTICSISCTEIDGDGKKIMNLSSTQSVTFEFLTQMSFKNIIFEDFYISNPTYNTNNFLFYNAGISGNPYQTLTNCKFRGGLNGILGRAIIASGLFIFHNCSANIELSGAATTNIEGNMFVMEYCDFEFNGDTGMTVYMCPYNSYITGELTRGSPTLVVYGGKAATYSIFDIITYTMSANSGIIGCVVNSDKVTNINSQLYQFDSSEILDPTSYTAISGFPMQQPVLNGGE